MTEIEVRKLMLIEKECINRDCNRDCANCDIVQEVGKLNEAYSMAIKALEKQVPKNVTNIHKSVNDEEMAVYGADARFGNCPTCGELVCSVWNECYCGDCGQRLDWSDE